jgi:Ion channel
MRENPFIWEKMIRFSVLCILFYCSFLLFIFVCLQRWIWRVFIVIMAFCGLGMFCGPVMELTSSWSTTVPGGMLALTILTIALGVAIFTYILEEMSELDAAYMSFITGTTIGYGDITPTSDMAKIAVALYAIVVINVISGLIQEPRRFLENLCREAEIEDHAKEE